MSDDSSTSRLPVKLQFGLGGEPIEANSWEELASELEREIEAWYDGVPHRPGSGRDKQYPEAAIAKGILQECLNILKSDKDETRKIGLLQEQLANLCRSNSVVGRMIRDFKGPGVDAGWIARAAFKPHQLYENAGRNSPGPDQIRDIALGAAARFFASRELGQIEDWATSSSWIEEKRERLRQLEVEAADAAESLRQAKSLLESHTALNSSESYWRTKAEEHASSANKWLGASVVLSFLALAYFFFLAPAWLLAEAPAGVNPVAISVGRGILFATISGLILWAIKFSSKNYLSHRHMENDSRERVVMCQSYLAFAKDADFDSKVHLDIILRSLFRPGADGIVSDESGPVPPAADLLAKVINVPGRTTGTTER